ncbi:hypothetical protein SDRG_13647 [Saprolegnia diclina VS20]|uniref:Uncharacterized protein n=1 Tax=Saprolegnia diclina (strain VS20) TaxID=1156394 RepID=T0PSU0_SAPDV|nr:hypothetical protein SDRG_13647 [Saprolegnia diclina VS20]EQC28569.1 hypothetical protein SDRG_13647 [Saprolegnia diclina VS20]|eukprot:XP_008617966.1 hypothetical protein SDRG_13647 [Saprolegnia diclina VS20]
MDADAPTEAPDERKPFCLETSDDVAMEMLADVIDHVGVISQTTALTAAVLRSVSQRLVQEVFDIQAMITIASSASFDACADVPVSTVVHAATDTAPLVHAIQRTLSYCQQNPTSVRKIVATVSIDGDGHVCGDVEFASVLGSLPLFLSPAEVTFMAAHAHGQSITAPELTKVCAKALKAAEKQVKSAVRTSSFVPTVAFACPMEPKSYPMDVHTPHEVPARPQPPPVSPDNNKQSTVRGTFVGRGGRITIAAGIVSNKLNLEDVEIKLDATRDDRASDSTTFSNIFSLGTPRQLSPRELARRRDILAYLEAVEATRQHDELVAKRKKELLERPHHDGDGGHISAAAPPLRNLPLHLTLDLPYNIATPEAAPPEVHRSPSIKPSPKHRRPSQVPTVAEPSVEKPAPGEPLPLFHLPQIETGRIEVGVKVVYPGKKVKHGSKRIPSRNSRLKAHNYNTTTDGSAPTLQEEPSTPTESTSLPPLPLSPLKPLKPLGSPSPPVTLPIASTSPIKVNQVRKQAGARVRGKPPARTRFNFSEAIARTLQLSESDLEAT